MSRHAKINLVSKLLQPISIPPKKGAKLEEKVLMSKSQKLMLDMGVIRQCSSGIYHLLPIGLRVLNKLKQLVRTSLDNIGAQEMKFPLIVDSNLWKKSGRWQNSGGEIFKFTDRHENEFCLSPTNEESAAELIANIPQMTFNQFPLLIYQINTKFRDELKPRCGLIRGREFVMKDLYSFHTSTKCATETYELVGEAYHTIFNELGLQYHQVKADPGDIKGNLSHEYHIKCDVGEDVVSKCHKCGNTAILQTTNDNCEVCQFSSLHHFSALEVGHTFMLGENYSQPIGAEFQNEKGVKVPLIMGSYGLGLTRIIAGSLEIFSSSTEIRWPNAIAPYQVIVVPPKLGSKEGDEVKELTFDTYYNLNEISHLSGNVILDDRTKMTIGKRIVHAKRTGYPFIVVIGSKSVLNPPLVELHILSNEEVYELTMEQLISFFKDEESNKIALAN